MVKVVGQASTGVCAGRGIACGDLRRSAACRTANGCAAETGGVGAIPSESQVARSPCAVIDQTCFLMLRTRYAPPARGIHHSFKFNRRTRVAKTEDSNTGINAAAEAVGSALGRVAGTVDRLKADHPHPIDEARAALAQGQAVVKDTAAAASEGVSAVIDTARQAVATVKKSASKARPRPKTAKAGGATKARRSAKPAARVKKAARRVVARAKKATRRVTAGAKKTVRRAKKTVRRAKTSFARGRRRSRR